MTNKKITKTAFLMLMLSTFLLVSITSMAFEASSTNSFLSTSFGEQNLINIEPIADRVICDTLAVADNCGAAINICGPSVSDCPAYTTTYTVVDAAGISIATGAFPTEASPEDCIELGHQAFGIYTVTYLVEDANGDTSTITYTIESRDCKAPVANCAPLFTAEIPFNEYTIELPASDFDAGSFDDCSGPVSISFDEAGIDTSVVFDCQGGYPVTLYVTDAVGNTSFCNGFVLIKINAADSGTFHCSTSINGAIETERGRSVGQAVVSMSGNFDATYLTGMEGMFDFPNIELGHDYTIAVEKDINPLAGVTTFDLLLIRKHIIGSQLLDSPYKIIAADVNNSESVTTFDLVSLRKLILNIDTDFSDNQSWRFVDASYLFPNPANPWEEVFPETIFLDDVDDDVFISFIGIKIGDVNISATPNVLADSEDMDTDISLDFGQKNVNDGFVLYQNAPNPYQSSTEISFELPTAATARLTLHDITGRVVEVIKGDYSKGLNRIMLEVQQYQTNILYYTLEVEGFRATKKMIFIK